MIQADEDVGKVAKASPVLISAALEVFLKGLLDGAVEVARAQNARTMTSSHVKAHIAAVPLLDFCKPAVEDAPDLPPPGTEEPATSTPSRGRKRAAAGNDGGVPPVQRQRGSGKGRGRGRAGAVDAAGEEAAVSPGGQVGSAGAAELAGPEALAANDGGTEPEATLADSIPAFLMGAPTADVDEDDDYDCVDA